MDKWVLVTEKLPTKEGLYIVTMDGEIAGQKEPFASTNYFENGQWDDGDSVIAWMRLPEPYRPKDNKEKPAWGDWILDKSVYKMYRKGQVRGNAAAMSAG